jgi:hypothetical protein
MPVALANVRSWGQTEKHLLVVSISGFDPGCVKTPTVNLRVEIPSRFLSI